MQTHLDPKRSESDADFTFARDGSGSASVELPASDRTRAFNVNAQKAIKVLTQAKSAGKGLNAESQQVLIGWVESGLSLLRQLEAAPRELAQLGATASVVDDLLRSYSALTNELQRRKVPDPESAVATLWQGIRAKGNIGGTLPKVTEAQEEAAREAIPSLLASCVG